MSRVRDLTAITSLDAADLFYVVDDSAGPNGGRKITRANLKTDLIPGASAVPFTPTGTIASTDTQAAIAEVSGDVTVNTTAIARLNKGWLQYSNSGQQTNSTTTFAALTIDTDRDSFANSLVTKSSATQFRTDFAGYVMVGYGVTAFVDVNDRGYHVRIAKNGSALAYTRATGTGKNQIERTTSVSRAFIISCAVNDLFTIEFASAESGVITTVPVDMANARVEAYRIT